MSAKEAAGEAIAEPVDWRLDGWADDVNEFFGELGIKRPMMFRTWFEGLVAHA